MNYFELYELPVSFMPDKKKVSQQYFLLQKKYHPDFFAHGSEEEKKDALEISAMANKGYKTLLDRDATIKYVLQLKGLLEEEEKYQLPPDFLMEVLELNEMKMDGADAAIINERAKALQDELYAEAAPVMENYKDERATEAELLKVKAYYYKNRYLIRILQKD